MAAPGRQHAVPVDLRRQRRGPLGHGRFLSFYLMWASPPRRRRADRTSSTRADGRRQRRDRRRDGRLPGALPALARADVVSVSADPVRAAGAVLPGDVVSRAVPERRQPAADLRT